MPGRQISPALAPYVTSLAAYDVDLGAPGIHRGLPSTSLTFVLAVDEPLDVSWAGDPGSRGRRWSTLSGLHSTPALIHHRGTQRGVQLGLTLAGARALFGVPAAALARELVDLAELDLTGGPARELRDLPERLASSPAAEHVVLVERALVAALSRGEEPSPRAEVGRALARLTGGALVQDVAAEVGLSRRHLGTLIRDACGLGAKELQRVARFEATRALVGRRPLADVAVTCGYADQSHLTREWVRLAGCTPTQWVREEFPFVQDHVDPDRAG